MWFAVILVIMVMVMVIIMMNKMVMKMILEENARPVGKDAAEVQRTSSTLPLKVHFVDFVRFVSKSF